MEKIKFGDLENCIRLANGETEIVVTTDFGPRVVAYNLTGGENVLGLHPHARIQSALGEYRICGGHRLWIAPEDPARTYAPDNERVEYFFDAAENSLRLVQTIEPVTQTQKEIIITLGKQGSDVSLRHEITNRGDDSVELAPWALTIMRGGGVCELPNETYQAYSHETLLPVRNLAVWAYTDLSDPRWSFDREFIRLRVDENSPAPQKIGVLNRQGWIRYRLSDAVFTKYVDFVENAAYPDLNSNAELYTAGSFVEIETLAPLQILAPGENARHAERWRLEPA